VPAGTRRKTKPDIYTVLLVIALLALIVGIVFLCLYNANYEWKMAGGPSIPATVALQSAPPPQLAAGGADAVPLAMADGHVQAALL
jgi:hypothetical protein